MEKDADILRLGRQFLRLSPQRQNKKRNRITVATSDSTPDMARLRFAVKDNSSTEEETVRAAATPSPSTPRTTASTSTAAALPPASPSTAGLFSDDSSSEDDNESYHTDSDNDGKQEV